MIAANHIPTSVPLDIPIIKNKKHQPVRQRVLKLDDVDLICEALKEQEENVEYDLITFQEATKSFSDCFWVCRDCMSTNNVTFQLCPVCGWTLWEDQKE